jgi:hypothetical protein
MVTVIHAIEGEPKSFLFWCPGCETCHWIDGRWTFNGNMEKPTIRASILVGVDTPPRCHIFVTDGQIKYLNDCTHKLAGQTIDMVPLPGDE